MPVFCLHSQCFPSLKTLRQIVTYIVGFVLHRLSKSLLIEGCVDVLTLPNASSNSTDDAIDICVTCEKKIEELYPAQMTICVTEKWRWRLVNLTDFTLPEHDIPSYLHAFTTITTTTTTTTFTTIIALLSSHIDVVIKLKWLFPVGAGEIAEGTWDCLMQKSLTGWPAGGRRGAYMISNVY